jgi:hypothetical protein
MTLVISTAISNKCLTKIITSIQPYIPANVLKNKIMVIHHVNEFLKCIDYILSGEQKFINYVCKSNKNNIIPMRHLYKIMTTIGIKLYT